MKKKTAAIVVVMGMNVKVNDNDMAYSEKQIESIFAEIIEDIEKGSSLRSSLKKDNRPSNATFFKWIDEDEIKMKQYARATEKRAEVIFEDILNIADENNADVYTDENGIERTNQDVVSRARLRIDARKWMLGKMNPKKYGEKLDVTSDGDKISSVTTGIEVRIITSEEEDD